MSRTNYYEKSIKNVTNEIRKKNIIKTNDTYYDNLPVIKTKQMNTVSFNKWYLRYKKDLQNLYDILHTEVKRSVNPKLFDQMDIQTFVEYVYYYSSKKISKKID